MNFPTVNLKATGDNIIKLRKEQGITVRQIQEYFGFEQPQAVYKWQRGESLPSVDNLFALSRLLDTTIDKILVGNDQDFLISKHWLKHSLVFLLRNQYQTLQLQEEVEKQERCGEVHSFLE